MGTVRLTSSTSRADVTAAWLAEVARAIDVQLLDVCADWGLARWRCTTDEEGAGGIEVRVFDAPDQGRVLGYHATDPSGQPYGKVFAFEGGQPLSLDDLARTISHEVVELAVDEEAADFRWGPGGVFRAVEACDPVEDRGYRIGRVLVSDYVLPAWFEAGAPGPYSKLGSVSAPFARTDGGYVILADASGVRTDPPAMAARADKAFAGARTARRLAAARAARSGGGAMLKFDLSWKVVAVVIAVMVCLTLLTALRIVPPETVTHAAAFALGLLGATPNGAGGGVSVGARSNPPPPTANGH